MDQLQNLREQYQELAGKKAGPKWDEKKLQEEIFKLKTGEEFNSPEINLGETGLIIKGNQTSKLPDDHPAKDYEFENVVVVPSGRVNKRPITAIDRVHVWVTPCVFIDKERYPDKKQKPFRSTFSIEEWQTTRPRYEKATNLMFDILHDPAR